MNDLRLTSLAVLALLLAACTGPGERPDSPEPGEPVRQIHVVNLGWHTGIALPRADIPRNIWPEVRDFPDAAYLEVGWGDWEFYQAPEATVGLVLKGAFLPTRSVLHVVGFSSPVQDYFPGSGIVEISLSEDGFEQLTRFIAQTYAREDTGAVAPLGPGLYPNSRFYPAQGTFHLYNNCNTWVARALHTAGCSMRPVYIPTAGNVMDRARQCGRVVRE